MTDFNPAPFENTRDPALPAALAAIALLESVLTLLVERGLIRSDEVQESLEVAIDSHLNAEPYLFTREDHLAAARVIRRFALGANAVRASARL